jgi:hypothetical protein
MELFKLTDLPKLFTEVMVDNRVHKAVKYVSEKSTIKVTRIGKPDKRGMRLDFRVTMGVPNYLERKFIKDCKKVGESFPVKKIQIKYYPVKK